MQSGESNATHEEDAEAGQGWFSFAKDMAQVYTALVFLAFLVWLIRWPFYGDDPYHFMLGSVAVVSIWFAAAALWMLLFSLFCRFPVLGIVFMVLCILAGIANNRDRGFESCIENRYFSTCD